MIDREVVRDDPQGITYLFAPHEYLQICYRTTPGTVQDSIWVLVHTISFPHFENAICRDDGILL